MADRPARALLEDGDVRRWYDNMRRSSHLSADLRLRRLNLFCSRTGTTPAGLASAGGADPKGVEDMLLDHVTWMEGRGFAPGYVESVVKVVKSWLEYNRVEIRRKIRVGNAGTYPRIADEKVPDQAQLRRMLGVADRRSRAAMSMMAFSGLRPQVLGLADASDGLRISDLADLRVSGGEVSFARTPAMVTVRAPLSKTRNKYLTFLSEEGCEHVLGYLRYRLSQGDSLSPDSPVIASGVRARRKGWRSHAPVAQPFMVTQAISASLRPSIWAVSRVRPYALRAYFDSQLLIAESHGCMTHSYRQFFMGHKGDMEARYTTNKGRLTEQMTEDMRRSYASSEAFLSTAPARGAPADRAEMLAGMWRKQAEMYGIDPASVLGGAAPRPAAPAGPAAPAPPPAAAAGDPAPAPAPPAAPAQASGPAARFDVAIASGDGELVARCSEGWDVMRELGDGRFLLRRAVA